MGRPWPYFTFHSRWNITYKQLLWQCLIHFPPDTNCPLLRMSASSAGKDSSCFKPYIQRCQKFVLRSNCFGHHHVTCGFGWTGLAYLSRRVSIIWCITKIRSWHLPSWLNTSFISWTGIELVFCQSSTTMLAQSAKPMTTRISYLSHTPPGAEHYNIKGCKSVLCNSCWRPTTTSTIL